MSTDRPAPPDLDPVAPEATIWVICGDASGRKGWVYHTRGECNQITQAVDVKQTTRERLRDDRDWRQCDTCAHAAIEPTPVAVIRETYGTIKTNKRARWLHPIDESGATLCNVDRQFDDAPTWSLAAYPDDSRICDHCRVADAQRRQWGESP